MQEDRLVPRAELPSREGLLSFHNVYLNELIQSTTLEDISTTLTDLIAASLLHLRHQELLHVWATQIISLPKSPSMLTRIHSRAVIHMPLWGQLIHEVKHRHLLRYIGRYLLHPWDPGHLQERRWSRISVKSVLMLFIHLILLERWLPILVLEKHPHSFHQCSHISHNLMS